MLRLSFEQLDLVDALVLRRHAALVAGVLAEAWPAVVARLRERWGAFVEAALAAGHRHGIDDPPDLAHYASLWCVWGPSFDDKPGFEWAREILDDPRRGAALKVHQLAHRTREELAALARRAPAGPMAPQAVGVAQFDAAWQAVETGVAGLGAARAIFPREQARPKIVACDVGTIDLMVAEAEGLLEYVHLPIGWQRAPVPRLDVPPLHWSRAPAVPLELAVPSQPLRGGPPARLNLKVAPLAVCDARVHPEVAHLAAQGRLAWKGRDTQRLSLALYALPPDPAAPQQGIAAPTPADVQIVDVAACGQRDAGAPFGKPAVQLRVVPATQWLTEIRHPAWPAMAWPGGTEAAPRTPPAVKLEADGRARDASAWQQGWAELPVKFRAGMEKLFNAWLRAVDASTPRLEVEASALVGEATVTWGWKRVDAATVAMRAAGQIDLIACSVDLRLSGEIVHDTARARVALACKGRSELRTPIDQLGEKAVVESQTLKAALRSFRFPFTVEVDALAGPSLATLVRAPMEAALLGALVGECGLKPRPDGAGFQWFYTLRAEPSTLLLACHDPVLGTASLRRALLPALDLVDWAAG